MDREAWVEMGITIDKQRGFTLIELLVVIAVIALLMAILMPALNKANKQAKDVVCRSNLRHWCVVFSMYADDNDGYFTEDYYDGIPEADAMNPQYSFAGGHQWPVLLPPYYSDAKLRFCPTATKSLSVEQRTAFWAWIRADLVDPDRFWEACGSYGLNSWASNPPPDAEDSDFHVPAYYWRTTNVREAANIPLLLDCLWAGAFPYDTDEPPPYYNHRDLGPEIIRYCIDRHDGAINALFVNCSVRSVGLKELWTLKWHREYDRNGPWTIAGFGGNRASCADAWDEAAPWMSRFPEY